MIDFSIKITIDEDNEPRFEEILKEIESIEGVEKIESIEGSYFEYNIDSDPFWDIEDYE